MELEARPHILRNVRLEGWKERIAGRWHYRDLAADPQWRDGWISFDAVTWNPDDSCVYCGLNSIDGDLLYRFDPATGQFTGLEARAWSDRFDVKIHRTLLYNSADRCFYFGTSMLHDVDQQAEAAGGKLVRYDPARNEYEILGVPVPKLYLQSIAADFPRGLIYGFTYPAEALFQFSLQARTTEILAYTGNSLMLSQPHNAVVDADGWLWGTYAETRAWDETASSWPVRLFKYHPEGRRFVWFDRGLARRDDAEQLLPDPPAPAEIRCALDQTRHTQDFGFCDSLAYDGKRYVYAGTVAGVLCRIDVRTDRVEKVAQVMAAGRFPALAFGCDGTLYGAGGMNGFTQVMRLRPESDRIECFYPVRDPLTNDGPARIHELAVDRQDVLYLAENDNHRRSSYLWSARLPSP